MALQIWELTGRNFRLGEGRPTDRLQFFITGAFTELEAEAAIAAAVPVEFNGLWLLNVDATEDGVGYWRGSANYGIPQGGTAAPAQLGPPGTSPPPPPPPAPNDPLGPEWSFDTTGGTRHITTSKQTRQAEVGSTFSAPDTQRAIGANKDGSVEGCDIVVPRFEFSTTRKLGALSLNYIKTLIDLTGTLNQDLFLGVFAAESMLFLGASGQYRDNDGWSVVYRFAGAPNRSAINIGSSNPLDRIAPKGHDYIWCTFETKVSNGFAVQTPAAAFVERVYDTADFNKLGL